MTIKSFTDEHKTYETTPEHCDCKAKHFNPAEQCKHQIALIQELNKAQKFLLLFARFDCRANGAEDTRRCYFEMSMMGL